MSAQLAQRLLPDLRVIRRGLEVQAVQREATDLRARVVAGDAVGVQHRAMLIRSNRAAAAEFCAVVCKGAAEIRRRRAPTQRRPLLPPGSRNETWDMGQILAQSLSNRKLAAPWNNGGEVKGSPRNTKMLPLCLARGLLS